MLTRLCDAVPRLWAVTVALWCASVPLLVILSGVALAVCCLCGLTGCRRLDIPSL